MKKQKVYQLKVTLRDSKPPIWRRLLVDGNTSLDRLHFIIQEAMGWENNHLYDFEYGGRRYTSPSLFDDEVNQSDGNTKKTTLNKLLLLPEERMTYTYDFGDNWEHRIVVEGMYDRDPTQQYPYCLAGRRACPPEDCGGIWGYMHLLEVLEDQSHPDYEEMREWLRDDFHPDTFDRDTVNKALQEFKAG